MLRQPGLIEKVIYLMFRLESKPNEHQLPSDKILKPSSINDGPCQLSWSYRCNIGMLNYIATSSCPDISFAMHQCARFSSNPKRSHELAVKRMTALDPSQVMFLPMHLALYCGHQSCILKFFN
jgi:hypothetical protein